MNLLLDETKLKLLLTEKRDYIGTTYDILGVTIPIVTYIVSLFCSDFHDTVFLEASTIRIVAYLLAGIYVCDLLRRIVASFKRKYNYELLYEDIRKMNEIKHYFSLVAIKDEYEEFSNRFLLYYDQAWKCWFFPNFKTKEEGNESFIIGKLSNALHIKEGKITLESVAEKVQPKFSRRDQIEKVYNHKLYRSVISEFPKEIQKDRFSIDQTQYRWMTIAEMEADENINEINGDVVSFVKETIK